MPRGRKRKLAGKESAGEASETTDDPSKRLKRRNSSLPNVRPFFGLTPDEGEGVDLGSTVQFDFEASIAVTFHDESPPVNLAKDDPVPLLTARTSKKQQSIRDTISSWMGDDEEGEEETERLTRGQAEARAREAKMDSPRRERSFVSTAPSKQLTDSFKPISLRFKLCKPLDRRMSDRGEKVLTFPLSHTLQQVIDSLMQEVFPGVAKKGAVYLCRPTNIEKAQSEIQLKRKYTLQYYGLEDNTLIEVRAKTLRAAVSPKILSGLSVKQVVDNGLRDQPQSKASKSSSRRLGKEELSAMVQRAFRPEKMRSITNDCSRLKNLAILPVCATAISMPLTSSVRPPGHKLSQIMNRRGETPADAGIWYPDTVEDLLFSPMTASPDHLKALLAHFRAGDEDEEEEEEEEDMADVRGIHAELVHHYVYAGN